MFSVCLLICLTFLQLSVFSVPVLALLELFCGFFTPAPLCALKKGASNSDVVSTLTLCIVHSPLWRCVGSDVWTVVADLPTPYPLCLVEWLGAWLDWSPVPVYFLCLELRPPALLTGRVLCSETLINIWVEPAIESVFFPDRTVRPEMDSAGADPVRTAVTQQGILLGQHSTQLTAASREVDQLTAQVAELNVRVQELQQEALASRSAASFVRSPPQAEPEPHANSPPPYDGDPNSCRAFLSQCSLVFALQPRRYIMEESQVAFVITLLKGRARDWATAVWDARAPFCAKFQDFRAEMIKLFDRSAQGDEAASQLVRLNQDGRSVTDYSIQFGTLAAACDWNEAALRARFREGLDDEIQDEIVTHELPRDFDSLVELALRVEGRLQRCRQRWTARPSWPLSEGAPSSALTSSPSVSDPEPMQVDVYASQPRRSRIDWLEVSACIAGSLDTELSGVL